MAIPDFNIQPMPPIDISTGLRFLQQQQENLMKEASDFMNARARMEQAQVDRETNAVRMAQLAEDRRQFDLKMPLLQQQANTDRYEAETDRLEFEDREAQSDRQIREIRAREKAVWLRTWQEGLKVVGKVADGIGDIVVGYLDIRKETIKGQNARDLEEKRKETEGARLSTQEERTETARVTADGRIKVEQENTLQERLKANAKEHESDIKLIVSQHRVEISKDQTERSKNALKISENKLRADLLALPGKYIEQVAEAVEAGASLIDAITALPREALEYSAELEAARSRVEVAGIRKQQQEGTDAAAKDRQFVQWLMLQQRDRMQQSLISDREKGRKHEERMVVHRAKHSATDNSQVALDYATGVLSDLVNFPTEDVIEALGHEKLSDKDAEEFLKQATTAKLQDVWGKMSALAHPPERLALVQGMLSSKEKSEINAFKDRVANGAPDTAPPNASNLSGNYEERAAQYLANALSKVSNEQESFASNVGDAPVVVLQSSKEALRQVNDREQGFMVEYEGRINRIQGLIENFPTKDTEWTSGKYYNKVVEGLANIAETLDEKVQAYEMTYGAGFGSGAAKERYVQSMLSQFAHSSMSDEEKGSVYDKMLASQKISMVLSSDGIDPNSKAEIKRLRPGRIEARQPRLNLSQSDADFAAGIMNIVPTFTVSTDGTKIQTAHSKFTGGASHSFNKIFNKNLTYGDAEVALDNTVWEIAPHPEGVVKDGDFDDTITPVRFLRPDRSPAMRLAKHEWEKQHGRDSRRGFARYLAEFIPHSEDRNPVVQQRLEAFLASEKAPVTEHFTAYNSIVFTFDADSGTYECVLKPKDPKGSPLVVAGFDPLVENYRN